nr:hypothetical protein [uncultured Draconibacterium sp.]
MKDLKQIKKQRNADRELLIARDVYLLNLIEINQLCEIPYSRNISLFHIILSVFRTVGFGVVQDQSGLHCAKSLCGKRCRRINLPGVLPVEKKNGRTARA